MANYCPICGTLNEDTTPRCVVCDHELEVSAGEPSLPFHSGGPSPYFSTLSPSKSQGEVSAEALRSLSILPYIATASHAPQDDTLLGPEDAQLSLQPLAVNADFAPPTPASFPGTWVGGPALDIEVDFDPNTPTPRARRQVAVPTPDELSPVALLALSSEAPLAVRPSTDDEGLDEGAQAPKKAELSADKTPRPLLHPQTVAGFDFPAPTSTPQPSTSLEAPSHTPPTPLPSPPPPPVYAHLLSEASSTPTPTPQRPRWRAAQLSLQPIPSSEVLREERELLDEMSAHLKLDLAQQQQAASASPAQEERAHASGDLLDSEGEGARDVTSGEPPLGSLRLSQGDLCLPPSPSPHLSSTHPRSPRSPRLSPAHSHAPSSEGEPPLPSPQTERRQVWLLWLVSLPLLLGALLLFDEPHEPPSDPLSQEESAGATPATPATPATLSSAPSLTPSLKAPEGGAAEGGAAEGGAAEGGAAEGGAAEKSGAEDGATEPSAPPAHINAEEPVKLTLLSPTRAHRVGEDYTLVSGLTSPLAEVTIGSFRARADERGFFEGLVSLPSEEGEHSVKVEARQGGRPPYQGSLSVKRLSRRAWRAHQTKLKRRAKRLRKRYPRKPSYAELLNKALKWTNKRGRLQGEVAWVDRRGAPNDFQHLLVFSCAPASCPVWVKLKDASWVKRGDSVEVFGVFEGLTAREGRGSTPISAPLMRGRLITPH